jgi:hypothetical protein
MASRSRARKARLQLLGELSDAGVTLDQLRTAVEEDRPLGLPLPAFDEPALDEEDMESWRMLRLLFDAGISEEQILQLGRPSGRWAAQIVDLLRQVFVETCFEPGDTERDFGLRLAKLSSDLVPALGPLTERPVRLHLRERRARLPSRAGAGSSAPSPAPRSSTRPLSPLSSSLR